MHRRRSLLVAFGAVTIALLGAARASAQTIDVEPPLPNIMLLLDTSGSMEKMIDGTDPESSPGSTCNPGVQSTPNRWGVVVQAMTGAIQPYYSCTSMQRTSGSLFSETYKINNVAPYDVNYHLPYHRPVSGNALASACVYTPGTLPGAAAGAGVGTTGAGAGGSAEDFPSNAIATRILNTNTACDFVQLPTGILDDARDFARFGLMTFDTSPADGVGVSGFPNPTPLNPPWVGLWSYYNGWDSGTASTATGWPPDCLTPTAMEVGARNPAAPPWEGRMMRFPAATASQTDVHKANEDIQKVINATRPYGATPIAGMFADAKHYFWTDPKGPQQSDPYTNCRDQYIILLSDGAPNLDLRPHCEATSGTPPGKCPFARTEETVAELAAGGAGKKSVKTFVIGFAVSSFQDQGQTVYCSNLVQNGTLSATCNDASKQALYGPCCTLQKVALQGNTGQAAFFADTAADLSKALSTIMSLIAASATTRTVPAYSPSVANPGSDPNNPVTQSSLYLSSFEPRPGRPWTGTVQRQRFECKLNNGSFSVPTPVVDPQKGDDFARNVNSHSGPERRFLAIEPAALSNGTVDATLSIRPHIAATPADKVNRILGTTKGSSISTIRSGISAAALKVTNTTCPNQLNSAHLTASECKDVLLDYTFGSQSTPALPRTGFDPFVSRYDNAFADIFHATPAVVSYPAALLRDESYQAFRAATQTNSKDRPTIAYVATNDGLLHAFDTSVSALQNNELWAMLLPAAMPRLSATYPNGHQLLLDGAPQVKDVVFERTAATLQSASNWHTMLVAGYGTQGRGYYAVDVTNGVWDGTVAADKGPQFRWQLTHMNTGEKEIFGKHSGTPAITTIFANPDNSSSGKREIGVAILPGGMDDPPSATAGCDRATKLTDSQPLDKFLARPRVRCWGANGLAADPVVGRSVAVVRVDTGEILRVFMRLADAPQSLIDAGRVIDTPFDSPMTGLPVVYPSEPGAVAQKVFIGDADGTVWKIDLTGDLTSSAQNWKAELYLDTINQTVDTNSNSWRRGQPIQVAPVVALDRLGNLVVEIATGDQESYTASGTNYVYSTTEKLQGTGTPKLRAFVNWYVPMTDGERVSGPMAVFDGVFYFTTFKPVDFSAVCRVGTARIWGHDYTIPKDDSSDAGLAKGGVYMLDPPTGAVPPDQRTQFIVPAQYNAALEGKVFPGVSVSVTPACAELSTSNDAFIAGAQHTSASNITPGTYSLMTQVGGKNTGTGGAATLTYSQTLRTPYAPTIVDSWAGVVE